MSGLIGYGTTLAYSSDGSSYTAVAEVTEITPPEESAADVKTTHLLSPSSAHEYIAGLAEGGEVSFKTLFDKTRLSTLKGLFRQKKYWKITYPDGTSQGSTDVFQGHLKKLGRPTPIEDKMELDCTIKVSGPVTFTPGT